MTKITPISVASEQKIDLENLEGKIRLYDLIGVVKKFRRGATARGLWIDFIGDFQAITPDGAIYEAKKATIPVMETSVLKMLLKAWEKHDRAQLQLAVRVTVKPEKSGGTVEYLTEWLLEPEVKVDIDNVRRIVHAN